MCLAWLLVLMSTACFLKWIYAVKVTMICLMSLTAIAVYEAMATQTINKVYEELRTNNFSAAAYLSGTQR